MFSMDKIASGSIIVVLMFVACVAGDMADDDLLKTILNGQTRNKLRDIIDEILMEDNTSPLETILPTEDRQTISGKRIFCNGAIGCINRMRRTEEDVQAMPILKKRPFCNGFFGCGNGKRSYNVPVVQDEQENQERKRLFCNMNGCGNMGKRTLYATLLDRLQPNSEEKSINV